MEKIEISNDLHLFGNRVPDFPIGIKDAFDKLVDMLPEGLARPYYGVSSMIDGAVIYYAMAAENFSGESKNYPCEITLVAEKGNYLAVTLRDWMSKTDSIKDVFGEMMADRRVKPGVPCIEWYISDGEMICMMKINGQ